VLTYIKPLPFPSLPFLFFFYSLIIDYWDGVVYNDVVGMVRCDDVVGMMVMVACGAVW